MHEAGPAKSPCRGRPAAVVQRHTIQDLLEAAAATLASKTVKETTMREIAAAAGTNEALISYYFGGKEGLMIAFLQESIKDHPNRRPDEIAALCVAGKSIRPLIEELLDFYQTRPSLVRMTLSEVMLGSSNIKSLYRQKYARDTPTFIHAVIRAMIDAGVYSSATDVEFATTSIMSMIVAPNFLQPATKATAERLKSSEWIDHIAAMVDLAALAQPD